MNIADDTLPMSSDGVDGMVVLLSKIIDSFPNAIVVTDEEGVVLLVNRRVETLFGYASGEIVGLSILKLVPDAVYGEFAAENLTNAHRGVADEEPELTGLHQDGHEISIKIEFSALSRRDGDIVFCSIQDLTEQKRVEKARLDADAEMRLLALAVRGANVSIIIADANLDMRGPRILFVNTSFTRTTGYSAEEVMGRPIQMLRGPDMDSKFMGEMRDDLRSGQPFQMEMTSQHKGGTLIRCQWSIAPLMDAQGRHTHFVGVQRDVTAEHERGRATEETQQFLGATLDALSAHVAVLSPAGFILAVNEAWQKFACNNGAVGVDFIGLNYLDQCCTSQENCDEVSERVASGLQAMIAGESTEFYLEYECSSPTEKRWFGVRSTPFNEPPPRRVVVAHTNITERKLAEDRLRRQFDAQRLLSDLSTRFIDLPAERGEMAIHDALAAVASFFGGDRAYLLQLEDDGKTLRNVYAFSSTDLPKKDLFPIEAWRACTRAQAELETEHAQHVELIMSHLRPGRVFVVPSVNALDENSQEYRILGKLGVRAILCAPMVQGRRVVGFVAVDMMRSERVWSEDDGIFLQSIPEILATTISRWRSEDLLRSIVRGVTESTGASFLSDLVEQICRGLEVDYALIAEIVGDGEARTLAFVGPNGTMDNVSLSLADTPAADIVTHGEACIYRKDIRAKFPNDSIFARLNVTAYAGVPLCDANDRVIGFMSVMHSRLLGATKLVIDVLRVFAARAASEIDRRRKDDELLALNHALEQRVAERAAEAARQAAAMDAATEGMAIWEGNSYVYMNDAHAQMFGYASGRSLLGHSWRELFPEDESKRIEREVFLVLQHERRFRGEFVGKRRDGSTFDVHIAFGSTDDGDLICSCEDITEPKRIQRELSAHRDELRMANIELSRAAQLKDEFLASMSHELRTPLNAILGMTETMIEQMVGPVNEKQKSCLRVVEESGRHLLSLINDILDLSKIEAGTLELELSTVDVGAVCEACLRLVQPAADAKNHRLSVSFSANVGVIRADERRVKQMLVNLLDNAVKFTPDGGIVGIELNHDPLGGFILFTVWDNGMGIAFEHQKLLFKPFSQLEHGLAKLHPGAGLGLSIVKRIAELHGGSVSVESAPGIGSRFTLSLPSTVSGSRAPGSLAQAESKRGTAQGSRPLRSILLVDDNPSNLEMLGDYLSLKGYDVHTASSAPEAIDLVDHFPISAILMDIQMPGMDGLEAIRILREDTRNALLPIIAVTALAMPGDRERCLAAGATEYVDKPVSPKGISRLLERLIDG